LLPCRFVLFVSTPATASTSISSSSSCISEISGRFKETRLLGDLGDVHW